MFCRRFQNRNGLGKTKNRAGRGKTNFDRIIGKAGFEKRQRRASIVLKIFCRLKHGFADFREGGKVHHGVKAIGGKKFAKAVAITGIADNQRNAIRQRTAVSARKIIQNSHLVLQQKTHRGATNVTRSSGNQNVFRHLRARPAATSGPLVLFSDRCILRIRAKDNSGRSKAMVTGNQ